MRLTTRTFAALAAAVSLNLAAARADDLVALPPQPANVPYPTTAWPEIAADAPLRQALDKIIAPAFEGTRPEALARTKAILVVKGGEIVAERYADGITRDTRLQSWSMAKSFLHAALGLAAQDGKVDPAKAAPVASWKGANDPRNTITVRQLAQMTDGLAFEENYSRPSASAMQMLFGVGRGDVGRFAAMTPSGHQPGTHWNYSSGSANILSRILRENFGGREAYRDYLKSHLFDRIGMTSAVAEFDASGTWIGSSYLHATARDYAKFGLLYLRGGKWEDRQLLPQSWIDFARTPTMASHGRYGALFWLNAADPDTGAPAISPDIPADTFMARGFGGQLIAIIPSRDIVLVMSNAAYTDDAQPIVTLVANLVKAAP